MHCARCGQHGPWVESCWTNRGQTELFHGYDVGTLCKGCHQDLVTDASMTYPELRRFSFEFFYTAPTPDATSVLATTDADSVLISHTIGDRSRQPDASVTWIDSGGTPQAFLTDAFTDANGYPTPASNYIEYVAANTTSTQDFWTLRSIPCTPAVRDAYDLSVPAAQRRTAELHRDLLREAAQQGVRAQPVTMLHGTTLDEYLQHVNILARHDALTDYLAIGDLAHRSPETIQQLIIGLRTALPDRFRLHSFGVPLPRLQQPGVLEALDSAASGYWYGNAVPNPDTVSVPREEWENTAAFAQHQHEVLTDELTVEAYWDRDWTVHPAVQDSLADAVPVPDSTPLSSEPLSEYLSPAAEAVVERFSFVGMRGGRPPREEQQMGLTAFA